MALDKRTKGGQGGGKGHSNMTHYSGTEIIKKAHKKHLRRESKRTVMEQEYAQEIAEGKVHVVKRG
jgi:hypothetical protein